MSCWLSPCCASLKCKTDVQILDTFRTMYHSQGKMEEAWIKKRVRTYLKIARKEME